MLPGGGRGETVEKREKKKEKFFCSLVVSLSLVLEASLLLLLLPVSEAEAWKQEQLSLLPLWRRGCCGGRAPRPLPSPSSS